MCRKLIFVYFVFVLGLALTGTANAQDPNLVGWWKFDGDALDSSGNGLNGTLMGDPAPVFAAGLIDQALDTATQVGEPDYVEITGYQGILGPNPFSIAAWINTSGNGTIMAWGSTAGGATRVDFRINGNRLRCESSGNVQGDTTLPADEWFHAAVTVKEGAIIDDPDVTLYLNGLVDNRTSTGGSSALNMAAGFDVTIARRHSSDQRWLDALLDDVRLYNRELTLAEIRGAAGLIQSYDPVPADGALLDATSVTLSWKPGPYAASHNVYFGTSLDDVAAGTGDTSKGNQTGTSLDVGVPEALVTGITYYWRIDDVEADGTTIHTGDVWSFFVPPINNYDPEPPDGATFARTDLLLTWMPGLQAVAHDVYFGEVLADVSDGNTPTASGPDPNYATGPLANEITYYWRVDSNDGAAINKGDVWSFTTMLAVPVTTEPNLVASWTCEEGPAGITAVDQSGNGNNGVLRDGAQFVAEGKVGGGLKLDGLNDYVAIEGLFYEGSGFTEVSVCAWIRTSKVQQIIASFDRNEYWRLQIGGEAGGDGLLGWEVMTDAGQIDTDEAANWPANTGLVNDGLWHHVAGVFDNGTLTMYIDGRPREPYSGGATFGAGDDVRWGYIGTGSEAEVFDGEPRTPADHFDGDIDEICIYHRALSEAEIVDMATAAGSLEAWSPVPLNGTTGLGATPTLSWFAGANTASADGHELYISADANAVINRTAEKVVLSEASYAITTALDLGTHYWAVDQVDADGVTRHTGPTWSFTVTAVITVAPLERLDA
ncbi:MAG: LamG domain-containing protein, partial [Planctomycetota bacterium]